MSQTGFSSHVVEVGRGWNRPPVYFPALWVVTPPFLGSHSSLLLRISLPLSAVAARRKSRSSTYNRLSRALFGREWATNNDTPPSCAGCRQGHFLQDQRSQPVRRALSKNWVNVAKPVACANSTLRPRRPVRVGVWPGAMRGACPDVPDALPVQTRHQMAEVPGGRGVTSSMPCQRLCGAGPERQAVTGPPHTSPGSDWRDAPGTSQDRRRGRESVSVTMFSKLWSPAWEHRVVGGPQSRSLCQWACFEQTGVLAVPRLAPQECTSASSFAREYLLILP